MCKFGTHRLLCTRPRRTPTSSGCGAHASLWLVLSSLMRTLALPGTPGRCRPPTGSATGFHSRPVATSLPTSSWHAVLLPLRTSARSAAWFVSLCLPRAATEIATLPTVVSWGSRLAPPNSALVPASTCRLSAPSSCHARWLSTRTRYLASRESTQRGEMCSLATRGLVMVMFLPLRTIHHPLTFLLRLAPHTRQCRPHRRSRPLRPRPLRLPAAPRRP